MSEDLQGLSEGDSPAVGTAPSGEGHQAPTILPSRLDPRNRHLDELYEPHLGHLERDPTTGAGDVVPARDTDAPPAWDATTGGNNLTPSSETDEGWNATSEGGELRSGEGVGAASPDVTAEDDDSRPATDRGGEDNVDAAASSGYSSSHALDGDGGE